MDNKRLDKVDSDILQMVEGKLNMRKKYYNIAVFSECDFKLRKQHCNNTATFTPVKKHDVFYIF
jgi:hypothetical protein